VLNYLILSVILSLSKDLILFIIAKEEILRLRLA